VTTASFNDPLLTAGTTYYYTIAAVDLGGTGPISTAEGSAVAIAAPFSAHFDFGPVGSPVATGYTAVAATPFSSTLGYGFLAGSDLWVFDRGAVAGTNALTDDYVQTDAGGATFAVNLPNGIYSVTPTLGDALYGHDLQGIYLQGLQVDSITTQPDQFISKSYSVAVTNGQLQFTLKDLGGVDLYDALDGLDIVQTSTSLTAPQPGAPALAAATDSGVSSSDGITQFDNSAPAKTLQFKRFQHGCRRYRLGLFRWDADRLGSRQRWNRHDHYQRQRGAGQRRAFNHRQPGGDWSDRFHPINRRRNHRRHDRADRRLVARRGHRGGRHQLHLHSDLFRCPGRERRHARQ
jgi:hypothetical protein